MQRDKKGIIMTNYQNILNAIGAKQTESPLTMEQRARNYEAFDRIMKEGIYLPDLMERQPNNEPISADVFAVMEDAVKDVQDVRDAKRRMSEEKARIIMEMCMKDAGFREARERYAKAVSEAYVKSKDHDKP